jgi:hypothetical protein
MSHHQQAAGASNGYSSARGRAATPRNQASRSSAAVGERTSRKAARRSRRRATQTGSSNLDPKTDFYCSVTTCSASGSSARGIRYPGGTQAGCGSTSAAFCPVDRFTGGFIRHNPCASCVASRGECAAGSRHGCTVCHSSFSRTTAAANDRPADGTAPSLQSTSEAGADRQRTGSSRGGHDASGARTSRAWTAHFPAPTTGRTRSQPATAASGRAPADASDSPVSDGNTSTGSWSGSRAFGWADAQAG